jgi:hypothetical protein
MAEGAAANEAPPPSDYVRVKRAKTTIFLYAELGTDTVHDLRAKVNLITKVPTTDIKFFIDKDGEIMMDENKSLKDQQVRRCLSRLARTSPSLRLCLPTLTRACLRTRLVPD